MPFRPNRFTPPMQTGMARPSASVAQQLQQRQQQQMANRVQRTRMPAPAPAPMQPVNRNQFAPQPKFNVPNPVVAPTPPAAGSFFQPPVTAQNPVGGFQTPPTPPTPPVDSGNFGTIQAQPAPISGVALPTPNPVPMPIPQPGMPSIGFGPAPIYPGPMLPGSMGDQVAQQSGGMNALPGLGMPPGSQLAVPVDMDQMIYPGQDQPTFQLGYGQNPAGPQLSMPAYGY